MCASWKQQGARLLPCWDGPSWTHADCGAGSPIAVRHLPRALRQHVEDARAVAPSPDSRSFTPDFSLAAVNDSGQVVGYVVGSTYTSGPAGNEERSAHTDYIGVRRDLRRQGIAELLLNKIWLAALRRGFTVASLGTDINNRSKAHLLYARLGYVAVEHSSAYRIDARSDGMSAHASYLAAPTADTEKLDPSSIRSSTRFPRAAWNGRRAGASRTNRCVG